MLLPLSSNHQISELRGSCSVNVYRSNFMKSLSLLLSCNVCSVFTHFHCFWSWSSRICVAARYWVDRSRGVQQVQVSVFQVCAVSTSMIHTHLNSTGLEGLYLWSSCLFSGSMWPLFRTSLPQQCRSVADLYLFHPYVQTFMYAFGTGHRQSALIWCLGILSTQKASLAKCEARM